MPLSPPHTHAINLLMNIPVAPLADSWYTDPTLLTFLTDILTQTLLVVFPRQKRRKSLFTRSAIPTRGDTITESNTMIENLPVDQALPPILLVLKKLASNSAEARKVLRPLIMPDDLDRSVPLNYGSKLVNYLITFMTSTSLLHIRDCVSELMFALCDEEGRKINHLYVLCF